MIFDSSSSIQSVEKRQRGIEAQQSNQMSRGGREMLWNQINLRLNICSFVNSYLLMVVYITFESHIEGLRWSRQDENKMIISLNNVFSFFSHVCALHRILIDLCWHVMWTRLNSVFLSLFDFYVFRSVFERIKSIFAKT